MEINSSDLSARLLATENISVVRARTRTASFDILSRVLTLPIWKDMTPEIEEMLVGHEVAHALYTTEEYTKPIEDNPKLHSYMNILEDVRIEKLIKRKYPGLRKRMNEGYRQLNDRDFFGVKEIQSFDDLLLIDKINLYFKAGFQCGVTFTPEEKVFVARAEKTESIDEIIQLSKDIYEFSKEKAAERKKNNKPTNAPTEADQKDAEDAAQEELDYGDDDDDIVEQEQVDKEDDAAQTKTMTNPAPENDEVSDEELESATDKAFNKQLEDLADTNTVYKYYTLDKTFRADTIIGYKRILSETHDTWENVHDTRLNKYNRAKEDDEKARKSYIEFKNNSVRAVNYLVKEFEMKKSAQMLKRAQTSKIGSLDMKKVWGYQLNDDLFRRVTTVPHGKNHGMMFLLDWSGSMESVIHDTLQQVVNLVMFCQRVQIPFQVLAFTSQYEDETSLAERTRRQAMTRIDGANSIIDCNRGLRLLELFSNKMSTSEFNAMARRVLDRRFFWNKRYDLGGTPLNEALVWAYHNIDKYIKANNIEKMTLITLSDGEGAPLASFYGRFEPNITVYEPTYKRVRQKHYIKDDVTQKSYELSIDSAQQTSTFIKMIKDRHSVNIIGFYISRNSMRDLRGVIVANLPNFSGDKDVVVANWRKEFKDKGFASIKNTGRDDFFLVPQESTKIVEGELEVDVNMSARSLAKNFGNFLNVKRTSRVLLSRFVDIVA